MNPNPDLDALVEAAVVQGQLAVGNPPRWVAAHSSLGQRGVTVFGQHAQHGRMPSWLRSEDDFLRHNLGVLPEEEIARRLGRTQTAVHLRWRRELRLPAPSKSPEILTAEQIADGLGVDSKSVHLLIDRGILPGRRLPTNDVTRVVRKITLLRFITNPRNWCYIDPRRIGLSGPRRTRHAYDHSFWQHARSLALRALARWDDEWWTPGQAGRYHGTNSRLINRDIRQGKLPAVRWGNWRVLRSDAVQMKYGHGKGHGLGNGREWSERADAFLILAWAVGFSTNAISAMCGWGTARVSYRLAELKRKKLVRPLIRKYGLKVDYNARTGELFADWKRYRKRFHRLARAMDRLKRGEPMSTLEVLYARGALLKRARWNSDARLVHALAGGVVSERRLRRAYAKMEKGCCKRRR